MVCIGVTSFKYLVFVVEGGHRLVTGSASGKHSDIVRENAPALRSQYPVLEVLGGGKADVYHEDRKVIATNGSTHYGPAGNDIARPLLREFMRQEGMEGYTLHIV